MLPRTSVIISHSRVNRAANVVAGEFLLAQSLAGRQRAPVLVTVDAAALTLTIKEAAPPHTVLRTDYFDLSSSYKLTGFSASPATVQVLPNGMASASMVVTVGGSDYYHQVTMTMAGQVRITK